MFKHQLKKLQLFVFILWLTAMGTPAFAGPPPEAPKGGFTVPYILDGVVSVQENVVTLNTADGRLFTLSLGAGEARKVVGKMVRIEAMAQQCDSVEYLKVKKVALIDVKAPKVILPPYKQGQRPAQLVESFSDGYVVKNFRWDISVVASGAQTHSWETVTIKPELVKGVYFVKKPFPPEWIAAHSFFLFTFEPGGVVDAKGREAKGMVLTIEAYQRTNQNFDLMKGLQNQFSIAWILTSWDNYLQQACRYQNEKLILYPVNLNDRQKVALVHESLQEACVNRDGEYYHTLTNNCTNNLVVLLNHVLDRGKQVKMWSIPSMIYNFRATMPVWVPPYLMKKGIFKKPIPEVNRNTWSSKWALDPDEYQP